MDLNELKSGKSQILNGSLLHLLLHCLDMVEFLFDGYISAHFIKFLFKCSRLV